MIADELTGTPFDVVDDPEGSRQVVGLRLRSGVGSPGHALLDLHRRLRHLAGDYGVRSVDLPFPATDRPGWEQSFGAKVRLGRPVGLLRLPAGILSAPVGHVERSGLAWRVREALADRLGGDPALPEATASPGRLVAVGRARHCGGPAPSLGEIARWIAVHPRTLQRALAEEGLTFAEILDCVRRQRARDLVAGTDLPFAEISARLGFAEPAVLTRCARRWWGRTPSQMRLCPGSA
ncbi:helix-turn-helix transcriptional regulator [Actinoplanes sp. NPDC051411]|uniref:helix-turn-helix transcriptional regulator n=1 Tax=Actinoplanes sp. NPDC051411 TaxID=3155522 RepID=UPI003425029A